MTANGPSTAGAINLLNLLSCPGCGAQMVLLHIKPGEIGFDRLTFVCRECHVSETIVTTIEKSRPRPPEDG
jgi:hypothetical protein